MTVAENKVVVLRKRARWDYALVPDGTYNACVIDNDVRTYFRGSPKLALWWRLVDPGYMETVLPGFYAIPGPRVQKPVRNGYYNAVGRASNLARDLSAMLGTRPRVLHGPFPRELVEPHIYLVRVVTVTTDRDQNELPNGSRYSRVQRVLGVVQ